MFLYQLLLTVHAQGKVSIEKRWPTTLEHPHQFTDQLVPRHYMYQACHGQDPGLRRYHGECLWPISNSCTFTSRSEHCRVGAYVGENEE